MDFETMEAREDEYQQEAFRFLQNVRGQAQEWRVGVIDVRIQIFEDGGYAFHSGDACYDTDHSGFWGTWCVGHDSDDVFLMEGARDMVQEAMEEAAWFYTNTHI